MPEDPRVGYVKTADKPSAAKKAPAKKTAAKKAAAGPAAALAKGGGPENPVADAAAVKATVAQAKEVRAQRADVRAERREQRASVGFSQRQADRRRAAAPKAGGVKAPRTRATIGWAWSGNRKLLTAEFLLCIIVLFLGTVTAPPGSKDDVHRAMVKGSALSGLFMLLALVSAGGKGAAKASTALGTLIAAAYLFTSSDVHNLAAWTKGFFAPGGPAWSAGQAADSVLGGTDSQAYDVGAAAGEAAIETDQPVSGQAPTSNEGTVGPGGTYTSTTGFSY